MHITFLDTNIRDISLKTRNPVLNTAFELVINFLGILNYPYKILLISSALISPKYLILVETCMQNSSPFILYL